VNFSGELNMNNAYQGVPTLRANLAEYAVTKANPVEAPCGALVLSNPAAARPETV